MSNHVVIEYLGKTYTLPVLLVGSAQTKMTHRGLADRLEEAMDGQRDMVVIEESEAQAFYLAVRSISVSLDRENLDWQRLLAELQVASSKGDRVSRSQILAGHKR